MIENVDDLIKILDKYRGKNILIKDIFNSSNSLILEVIEENGVCLLLKSVRDY